MIIIARKGNYTEWLTSDGLLRLEGWARDGLTDEQIAHNMGYGKSTLYRLKNEHSEIRDAIKKGKAPVDMEVENALLKRALGYDYEETVTEIYKEGNVERQHIRKMKRHMPADVTAQIYWLNNRRSDRWKNRKAVESEQHDVTLDKAKDILGGVRSAID